MVGDGEDTSDATLEDKKIFTGAKTENSSESYFTVDKLYRKPISPLLKQELLEPPVFKSNKRNVSPTDFSNGKRLPVKSSPTGFDPPTPNSNTSWEDEEQDANATSNIPCGTSNIISDTTNITSDTTNIISDTTNITSDSTNTNTSNSSNITSNSKSSNKGKSGSEGKASKRLASSSTGNCPALAQHTCVLETRDLWDRFHEFGTEMIVTKTGR